MNYLVDPSIVTNYNRDEAELQLFFLFCQTVAGKTAKVQARLLNDFLILGGDETLTPFAIVQKMVDDNTLMDNLKVSRLGQYRRMEKGFSQSLALNLKTASLDDLLSITGVGNKTARFFLLHSRPNQEIAVLDTHILKYLREQNINAPTSTPSDKIYLQLEQEFLKLAHVSGMTVADFDLMLWNKYSR